MAVRSRQARRTRTGQRVTKSRTARRKTKVERHYHRRYAGVLGAKPRRTRKSTAAAAVRRKAPPRRLAVTPKPRTYRRRISKPATKAPPITASSYLSMF